MCTKRFIGLAHTVWHYQVVTLERLRSKEFLSPETYSSAAQSGNEVLECLESCWSPVPTRRVKLDSDVMEGGGSSGRSRGDALTETQERQADSDPLRPLFIWVTFWQMLPPLTGCHHKGGSFPFSQSWRIILKDWFRNMSLTTKFHHHNHTVTITISHLTWLHLEHKIPGNLEQVFATKWKHVFLQCR